MSVGVKLPETCNPRGKMSAENFRNYHLNDADHHELALELCRVQAQLAEMRRLASDYGLMSQLNKWDRKAYVDGVLGGNCQALTESARLSAIRETGYVGMIEQESL